MSALEIFWLFVLCFVILAAMDYWRIGGVEKYRFPSEAELREQIERRDVERERRNTEE